VEDVRDGLAGVVRDGIGVPLDRAGDAAAAAGLHRPAHRAAQPRRHLGDLAGRLQLQLGLGVFWIWKAPTTATRKAKTSGAENAARGEGWCVSNVLFVLDVVWALLPFHPAICLAFLVWVFHLFVHSKKSCS